MTWIVIAGTAIAIILAAVEIRIARRRAREFDRLIAQAVELARRAGPYR